MNTFIQLRVEENSLRAKRFLLRREVLYYYIYIYAYACIYMCICVYI